MMTAMARLPCKPISITQQQQQQQQQQRQQQQQQQQQQQPQLRNGNFGNGIRNYWDMQTRQQQSTTPTYVRSQHRHTVDHTGKRRSAVELLQESKAFYVKSEIVLDRKQELKNSGHLQVAPSTAPGAPPRLLRKCGNGVNCNAQQLPLSNPPGTCCWANCQQDRPDGILSPQRTLPPPLPPKSPRLISAPQRRTITGSTNSATNGSDQLQTKLRRLLNTDSKENIFCVEHPGVLRPTINNNGRASPLTVGHDDTDCRSMQHLNPDIKFKFGRSNSHSHTSGKNTQKSNISPAIEATICHKSLPDLHTSVSRRRSSLSPRASSKSSTKVLAPVHHYPITNNCPDCETSSDYSARSFKRDAIPYHSTRIRRSLGSAGGGDASSVLSSGGRTQKSSGSSKLSHGATARDSGGSSGHCTHRSEPPPSKIQDSWNSSSGSHVIRRDSGASTQHSNEKEQQQQQQPQHQQRPRKTSYVTGNSSSAVIRNSSPNSDSSSSPTDCSPTCNSRFSDVWKEGRGRPILRSKSDISDRYWRHCDNARMKIVPPRPPRSVTELENFFNQLGLDSHNYQAITALPTSKSSSPIFFDSVSSVDSALGLHSWTVNNQQQSNNCNGGQQQQWQRGGNNCSGNDDTSQRVSDPPSIVERNARIIKWLCQCRKVQFGYS